MKVRMAIVGVAALMATQAFGQYRVVQGKIYLKNDPQWTVIAEHMEVLDNSAGCILVREFTEQDTVRGAGGVGNAVLWPVYNHVKTYHETIALTNCAFARGFRKGQVIRGPLLAMRVGTVKTDSGYHSVYTSPEGESTVSYHVETVPLYDYGTEYIQPIAKTQVSTPDKTNDAAQATFKFHQARAEDGNPGSQFRLGQLYLNGAGCETSTNKARAWFAKAAAQGNLEAKEALKALDQ